MKKTIYSILTFLISQVSMASGMPHHINSNMSYKCAAVFSEDFFENNLGKNHTLPQILLVHPEFGNALLKVQEEISNRYSEIHISKGSIYIGRISTKEFKDKIDGMGWEIQIEIRYFHYLDKRGDLTVGVLKFQAPLTFGGTPENFIYKGFEFKL